MKTISLFFVSFLVLISYVSPLMAAHGVSIDGQLKYASGFERFGYASEHAVKGGHLVMHGLGSFDKMNPMTLKGLAPDGLNELVFETLAVAGL
ncbi:MAG: ABC transporter substrate-binding protein, partial [Desulfobulbaceae bacterium]|nr:ABC transporter substrate-binding protein [Desulfobulbaceae bacterium]